jgi:hypothetical protein
VVDHLNFHLNLIKNIVVRFARVVKQYIEIEKKKKAKMILTTEIEVKLTQFNYHHYERLGYDTKGKETIMVQLEHIGKEYTIHVKCDICDNTKFLKLRQYYDNYKKHKIYACSNKCAVIKGEMTCMEKYGTKYALQNDKVKSDLVSFFNKKYGVDNPSQVESIQEKRNITMMERFGVKSNFILPKTHKKAIEASITEESKLKRSKTNLERYGVDNYTKTKEYTQNFIKDNIAKFGVEYPAQNIDIHNKTQKSGLKIKDYNGTSYQGTYELDFLKFCESNSIKVEKPKSVKYRYNGKNRWYHPDFIIDNLLIEIKSDYYYKLMLEKNLAKQESCIEQGYKHIFIINKDYTEFLTAIKKGNY